MIPQRQRDMIDLACALSWELDQILPRLSDEADSWDSLACALVRRMLRDDEKTAFTVRIAAALERNGNVIVIVMSPGGDA